MSGRICETEAYRNSDDPASHAFRGKTPRSAIMFGQPGHAYIYFIYGMYHMLNVVTEPEGTAGAVLIRALEPLEGLEKDQTIYSGPGKLCKALGLTLADNGASLSGPRIMIGDDGFTPINIGAASRIGITKGQEKLWRFFLPSV